MHQRRIIRDAVVARLTGRTVAARVLPHPTEPWKRGALPVIGVYTDDEVTEQASKTNRPRELWRDLDVVIVAWVVSTQANPGIDALDDLAEQIEAAMDIDPYFRDADGNPRCGLTGAVLASTEVAIQDDDQRTDPLIGAIRLVYSVPYTFTPAAPADLADFLRTNATTQIDGAGADNTVSDLFNQQP